LEFGILDLINAEIYPVCSIIKIGCGSKPEVSSRNTRHEIAMRKFSPQPRMILWRIPTDL
jgi:hypothetical protein